MEKEIRERIENIAKEKGITFEEEIEIIRKGFDEPKILNDSDYQFDGKDEYYVDEFYKLIDKEAMKNFANEMLNSAKRYKEKLIGGKIMSKKHKCKECINHLRWVFPKVITDDNYNYAKQRLDTLKNTCLCGETMETKPIEHEQYCDKFREYEEYDNGNNGDFKRYGIETYEIQLADSKYLEEQIRKYEIDNNIPIKDRYGYIEEEDLRRAMITNNEIKPCPFCGSTNIGFSIKVGNSRLHKYHIAMYCKECHCSGRRLLVDCSDKFKKGNRVSLEKDEDLRFSAITAWNMREI